MLKYILIKEVVAPISIILITTLLYFIVKSIIKKAMSLRLSKIDVRRHKTINGLIINVMKYFLIVVDILMILSIYGINTSALVASLGVVGLVVGLAFQDILKDFFSGISIIVENQYGVGDTVTINGFKGEVLSLGLRTTKLKSYTGEVKIMANRNIQEVINHSFDFSKAIVDVATSYAGDTKKIEKVLNDLCDRLSGELTDIKGDVEMLGIENLADSGIVYRITVNTKPMKHLEIQRQIRKEIKLEFEKHNIEIPYNQVVVHNA